MVKDLTGEKFGRLTVIEFVEIKNRGAVWKCVCECGKYKNVRAGDLKAEKIKSCGCLRKEVSKQTITKLCTTHGQRNTRLYRIWRDMKQRCYDRNAKNYHNYGGRGIEVCLEWKNSFKSFYEWSINNGYNNDLSIDRINVNGNYYPDNCRWATVKEQCNNTRKNVMITYNGKSQTLKEWAEELNINYHTLWKRIKVYKWSAERALNLT